MTKPFNKRAAISKRSKVFQAAEWSFDTVLSGFLLAGKFDENFADEISHSFLSAANGRST